jgi:hypothetical protein
VPKGPKSGHTSFKTREGLVQGKLKNLQSFAKIVNLNIVSGGYNAQNNIIS